MPSLTIRDCNTGSPVDFFYKDSGPPLDRRVYTTLVVVHGICFHSAAFQHVIPLAGSKGFRMVCLNRRDYPGTTPYAPSEVKAVSEGGADEHAAFLKTRGLELLLFLDGIIDALSLPEPTQDGEEGGLGLMGWSLGNIFTLSTVVSISSLQPQVRNRLQRYLRKCIMFDSPTQALGIPGAPVPAIDQAMSLQEFWVPLTRRLSCYFTHGDPSTRNVKNLEFMVPDLTKKSVVASLSPEKFSSLVDYEASSRTDLSILKFQNILFGQMRKALFDLEKRSFWPKLDMWCLYCSSSEGEMVHAAWEVEKMAEENKDQPVHFLTIEDAHHLVFWDEPEKAIQAFDYCLRHCK